MLSVEARAGSNGQADSLNSEDLFMGAKREKRLTTDEVRMLAYQVEQGVFVDGTAPSRLSEKIGACFSGPCYSALQTSLADLNFGSFDQAIEAGRYGEIVAGVSTRCGLKPRIARRQLQRISVAQHIKEGKPAACSWEEYSQQITTAAREAEDRFIKGNLALVVSIARRSLRNSVIGFMDNIQEGNTGLLTTIRQYDYRLGLSFSTYATRWISQAIRRALNGNQPLQTPDNLAVLIPGLFRNYDRLTQELGRAPTLLELAQASGLSEEMIFFLVRASQQNVSLQRKIRQDGAELWELLGDPESSDGFDEGERGVDNGFLREKLEEAAEGLTPVERAALFAQYGVGFKEQLSYRKTGKLLEMTGQGADNARKRAMEKMRRPDRRRQLEPYL